MFKKNKGITLIALIITIIIMLILVGVSIQLVINSGLFETAKNAGKGTQDKAKEEASLGSEIVIDGKTYASAEDYAKEKEKLPEGAGKRVPANTTFEYKSNGKTAIIPGGFTVSGIPSEVSIDGGLVIYLIDKKDDGTAWTDEEIAAIDWTDGTTVANLQTTYDQFVWIPIARENINDMYMCQSEDGTKSCNITVENGKAKCTTHNSNLMAGRLYATDVGDTFNSTLTTQTYTANSGFREPDVVTGNSTGDGTGYDGSSTYLTQLSSILGTTGYDTTANFKQSLQNEYNDIVKSVYENQGFYVGRYETSGMVDSNTNATIKVVAGTTTGIDTVTWYRMYAQQKKYAENKGLTNTVGSTMIQGAAYDQVMKFVNTANYDVTQAGNVAHGYSQGMRGIYQTGGLNYPSGATVAYKDISKNIYDLEGNVLAWTAEAYNTDGRVNRGGTEDSGHPASNYGYSYPNLDDLAFSFFYLGTVSQLYVK